MSAISDWPERVADERVSIRRIRGEAVDAPWLEEAAQAIAGRAEPCHLNARLESGDAGYWIGAETTDGDRIVGALSGRLAGDSAIWTWLAIDADWRVRAQGNQYLIIDISVEGVSMAVTQRSEFASVIKNHGFEGLLAALRARTDKIAATAN